MKIQIDQSTLSALLSRVSNAVEKRNTLPILSNILLSASGDTLTATGTDMDVEVTTTALATVEQPGSTTVSAALLSGVVGKLRKGSLVSLEADGLNLNVTSGRSVVKLSALPIEDFPRIADTSYEADVDTTQEELARLLNLTAFAMSTEQTRYYLNGVYLHNDGGNIRAVSTDGHRLAKAVSNIEDKIPGVIIPTKTVNLLRSLLTDGNAKLSVSDTKIKVDVGHSVIVSKIIDGTFPDYSRIIPSGNQNCVKFSADSASHAIGLVSLVSQEKARSVRFEIEADCVGFYVQDSYSGNARETIDAELSGEPLVIGMNSKYALDCMALANKGGISVEYSDALSPVLVKYDDEPEFIAVIMPVRI